MIVTNVRPSAALAFLRLILLIFVIILFVEIMGSLMEAPNRYDACQYRRPVAGCESIH